MASTFKIFQEGKDELVIASFSVTQLSAPNGYLDCGLYKLKINGITPSGKEPPSYQWMEYVDISVLDGIGRHLLQYYTKNAFEECFYLFIKANISNTDCEVDTGNSIQAYPNGKMLCEDIHPSGAAAGFELTLETTDNTKVTIDSTNKYFNYIVTG